MNYRSPQRVPSPLPIAMAKLSTMGKLFVTIFLMVVFEGALRKWISSELTMPLVAIRDSLAIYGIYWSMSRRKLVILAAGTQALWLWSAAVVIWGLFQVILNQSSFVIYLVGLRFWLLYLWFAYAAAVSLTRFDFSYISKLILKITIFLVPLIIAQFFQPPGAFINQQVDGDEDSVFRLTEDIVRTTGTFSFTAGQTTLLAMISPFALATLNPRDRLFNNRWIPVIVFLALSISTMLSGSRSALVTFLLLFIAYILIELWYGKAHSSSVVIIFISLCILVLIPYYFSSAVDATTERIVTANDHEGLLERIMSIFLGESVFYDDVTAIGFGIGAGTNFVGVLSETTFLLGETEATRTIMEGGLLGIAFIGVKLLIVIIGLRKSVKIAKATGLSLPLLLWFAITLALFAWSIIGQLTVNALGYLLLGLGIAVIRLTDKNII